MEQSQSANETAPRHLRSILNLSFPVAMGYIPLGAVFGFLLVKAGGEWWIAPLASLLIFAGAAQFMMISMLSAGASITSIALATLVINLRHIFYGLSLLGKLPANLLARGYMIWSLTDENYSVLTTMNSYSSDRERLTVVALNHCWWIVGSTLGAFAGLQIPTSFNGIEFSLTALFAVLAVEQWRSRKQIMPFMTALVAYSLAKTITPNQALLASLAVCVLVGLVLKTIKSEVTQ